MLDDDNQEMIRYIEALCRVKQIPSQAVLVNFLKLLKQEPLDVLQGQRVLDLVDQAIAEQSE